MKIVQHRLVRSNDPASELKIWQAARATAAAPVYFTPFTHLETMTTYSDGAIHHNCPAFVADQERRLIWSEVGDWPADFTLSLGTGLSKFSLQNQSLSPEINMGDGQGVAGLADTRGLFGIRYALRVAFKMIDDQLDCENRWKGYYEKMTSLGANKIEERRRNMRINLHLPDERPGLDNVDEVDNMERQTWLAIQHDPGLRAQIHEAAHRLIASSFYFEKASAPNQRKGSSGNSYLGEIWD